MGRVGSVGDVCILHETASKLLLYTVTATASKKREKVEEIERFSSIN